MDERRIQAYLRTFDAIWAAYPHDITLARFLNRYYKNNKQMGSKDRRVASSLVYSFCRIGKAAPHLDNRAQLAIALYLCKAEEPICAFLDPLLYGTFDAPLDEKYRLLQDRYGFLIENIFPAVSAVSPTIDKQAFIQSHFIQPSVFIRIHPGQEARVKAALQKHHIAYLEWEPLVLSFAHTVPLHTIKELVGRYEVQDYASQQTAQLFQAQDGEKWWDACAGSGGKSILLKQMHPQVDLTVSDIRLSILRNLEERFDQAGIQTYQKRIIDLEKGATEILDFNTFDGIILDAPCSGSGTWGRTPEMLRRFNPDRIQGYANRQKLLATNVIPHLKVGKPFIYITCSVYEAENEAIVRYLEGQGLILEQARYFKGYAYKADTLFAARLVKG